MPYPEDHLAPDEELILHRHPHWKMLVVPAVVLLAVVAVATFLAALIRNQSWANIGWIVLAVVAIALIARFTLTPFMRWGTTHFVLTDRRVLVRQGVLSRSGLDIPMSRINSVRFRHGLLDRMLGTGTLIIESASHEPLEFDDIPHVERVHALLYNEVYDADHDDVHDNPEARDRRRQTRSTG